jgi:hypothetical protein
VTPDWCSGEGDDFTLRREQLRAPKLACASG